MQHKKKVSYVLYSCVFLIVLVLLAVYIPKESSPDTEQSFTATTQSVAYCGNGIVEAEEECDGHDRANRIYCNQDCTLMELP